jgi:hypothetical protein
VERFAVEQHDKSELALAVLALWQSGRAIPKKKRRAVGECYGADLSLLSVGDDNRFQTKMRF